jgi:hypothetical protein
MVETELFQLPEFEFSQLAYCSMMMFEVFLFAPIRADYLQEDQFRWDFIGLPLCCSGWQHLHSACE